VQEGYASGFISSTAVALNAKIKMNSGQFSSLIRQLIFSFASWLITKWVLIACYDLGPQVVEKPAEAKKEQVKRH